MRGPALDLTGCRMALTWHTSTGGGGRMDAVEIEYRLSCPDRSEYVFSVQLDSGTLAQCTPEPSSLPLWTELQFHQCPNCPLDAADHPHCPVAVNLVALVRGIGDLQSHEPVQLHVREPRRTTSSNTTAQRAVSSLLGLIMGMSACPHTAYFRPMARFHLPLASKEETVYRATSMYLLAQYFAYRDGESPDLDLNGLARIYANLEIVNRAMAKRLRNASEQDAAVNAVVILDVLAKTLPHAIVGNLIGMRQLFSSYLA
jgi:hypothetical protein